MPSVRYKDFKKHNKYLVLFRQLVVLFNHLKAMTTKENNWDPNSIQTLQKRALASPINYFNSTIFFVSVKEPARN